MGPCLEETGAGWKMAESDTGEAELALALGSGSVGGQEAPVWYGHYKDATSCDPAAVLLADAHLCWGQKRHWWSRCY